MENDRVVPVQVLRERDVYSVTPTSRSDREAAPRPLRPPVPMPSAVTEDAVKPRRGVCPFCGTVREPPEGACPRCTMADTAETRAATRARVGPWYVLQARNPAAPGMKLELLLAFARRGQVTARSVVRGPTTHQLWRFAGNARGLSREFGLCYSCQASLEPTAAACPQCGKSQEPPADADALLDVAPPTTKRGTVAAVAQNPVMRELPRPPHPVAPADPTPAPKPSHIGEQATRPKPTATPASEPLPSTPPAPAQAPAPVSSPPPASLMNVQDLAIAFHLNPQTGAHAGGRRRRFRGVREWLRSAVAVTLMLVMLGLAVTVVAVAKPDWRRPVTDWAQAKVADVRHWLDSFSKPVNPPAAPVRVPTTLPAEGSGIGRAGGADPSTLAV